MRRELLREVGTLVQELRIFALYGDPEGQEAERNRGHLRAAPVGTVGREASELTVRMLLLQQPQ